MENGIEGTWNSDMNDLMTKNNIGNVTMTFTDDGRLIYDLHQGRNIQRMYMTYQISGDLIISDQQSMPQEQKTRFKLVNNDQLHLEFDGIKTVFRRAITQ